MNNSLIRKENNNSTEVTEGCHKKTSSYVWKFKINCSPVHHFPKDLNLGNVTVKEKISLSNCCLTDITQFTKNYIEANPTFF